MKIAVVSDLHLEFMGHSEIDYMVAKIVLAPDDVEVLIIAGDVCSFRHKEMMHDFFDAVSEGPFKKIYFVPGNHEYYGCDLTTNTTLPEKSLI